MGYQKSGPRRNLLKNQVWGTSGVSYAKMMAILETILDRQSFFGLLEIRAPRKTTENHVLSTSGVYYVKTMTIH